MIAFLAWYLITTLLGWLTFPMVYRLFPALADRGYSLSRAAGLLVWSYAFWLFTSLGLTENNVGGVLFSLAPLVCLTTLALMLYRSSAAGTEPSLVARPHDGYLGEMLQWARENVRTIAAVEILFLAAFAFLAFIRAGNPTLDNAEKPMELMFINAILRSPAFPPHDAWLSGYAISYYYFGYVMTAMLAQLAGLSGSIAHNLMTALVFGLAAVGAYGLLYDLLVARQEPEHEEGQTPEAYKRESSIGLSFLAPLFLLLISNLEGFLEVLHRRGIFWAQAGNFWTWLGIQDLNQPPALPLGWIPDRFWWWWRASRVITDYDLAGNVREVIDEFPFFSFLHGDLHPHVLAIPFNLLAIAIALNLFFGGWRGRTGPAAWGLKIHPAGFFAAALTLGGLAFLNTWDILVGAALIVLAYAFARGREQGWNSSRLGDLFSLGIPLAIVAILLYLPFYIGFASQAGGILPNIDTPTRGAQLWVMFAPLFLPVLALLLYLWRSERLRARWRLSLVLVLGLVFFLWLASWMMAWYVMGTDSAFAQQYLASQGMAGPAALFQAASLRRISYLGGLLSMLALLWPALAMLIAGLKQSDPPAGGTTSGGREPRSESRNGGRYAAQPTHAAPPPRAGPGLFILFLIVVGCLLVIAPEFVYLRDQFGTRMNTIFKFYYQAWLLWSVAAAFGIAILLRNLRSWKDWGFRFGLIVLLILSLTYPVLALSNKTNGFNPPLGWTLDDFRRLERGNPDEAAAIKWLRSASYGVVAEAIGGSYTGFGRISEYTGLPTVLGWPGHESQWRGTNVPQGSRAEDIATLYTTSDWSTAQEILSRYNIRYVYIGGLERSTYPVHEDKFARNLAQAFQQGTATIYEAP